MKRMGERRIGWPSNLAVTGWEEALHIFILRIKEVLLDLQVP